MHSPHDYPPVVLKIELQFLAKYRHIIKFLSNLLTSKIDLPVLLFLISFKVPQWSFRSCLPFCIPLSTKNYMENEYLRYLISIVNVNPLFLF